MNPTFLKAAETWMNIKSIEHITSDPEQALAMQRERFRARNVMNKHLDEVCKSLSPSDQKVVREFVFCVNSQASEPRLGELYRTMVLATQVKVEDDANLFEKRILKKVLPIWRKRTSHEQASVDMADALSDAEWEAFKRTRVNKKIKSTRKDYFKNKSKEWATKGPPKV